MHRDEFITMTHKEHELGRVFKNHVNDISGDNPPRSLMLNMRLGVSGNLGISFAINTAYNAAYAVAANPNDVVFVFTTPEV